MPLDHRIAASALLAALVFVPSSRSSADDSSPQGAVVLTTEAGAKQPQVAVDASGRIFVAFGRGNTILCAVSADGGKTFRTSEVASVPSLALGMRRGPRVAATNEAVVVSAIAGKVGKGQDGDLLTWRSTDGGSSWTGPTRVNRVEGSAREGLHAMASRPDGTVYCSWLDLRNKGTELYGARSTDGGASWEPDALVYRSPDRSICQCCHPSVAFAPDGTLLVMWRNMLKGARDMYLARSTDGGGTFSEAQKLGEGTWPLNACPMDGGSVSASGDGQIRTVWMRAGSTFLASPGQPETKLGPGVQGWMTSGPGGPYAVWLASRPGKLMMQSPGSKTPQILAENAIDPVIASAPQGHAPVVAVWEGTPDQPGITVQVLTPN